MAEDKIFWTEFIEEYEHMPSLWKVKSKEYCNRVQKNSAYEILVEKLKEKDPAANREMVVKKINNFRTNYRRELKKIKESEKSGAGADDIYVPTLWYFPLLSFLEEQEDTIESRNSMDECVIIEDNEPRSKKKKLSEEDKLIMLAQQTLEKTNNRDDSLSQSWASQYNQMDEQQKILSRKMISDILFQGCMKNLQVNHTVQLQNMFNPPIATSSLPSPQFNTVYPTPRTIFINNPIRVPTPLRSNGSVYNNRVSTPINTHSTSHPNLANNRLITVPTPLSSSESSSNVDSEYILDTSISYEGSPGGESTTNTRIHDYFSQFGPDLNFGA